MPFAWGYDINDGYGGAQYHKENGDEYGKRTGSYGYTDAYGIYRQVDYVGKFLNNIEQLKPTYALQCRETNQ